MKYYEAHDLIAFKKNLFLIASRNTWFNDLGVDRVVVDLYSDGMPIETEIELWYV